MKSGRSLWALLALLLAPSAFGFYNPVQGRWLSRDPIGERDAPNPTMFVRNRPVQFYDLLGKATRDVGSIVDDLIKNSGDATPCYPEFLKSIMLGDSEIRALLPVIDGKKNRFTGKPCLSEVRCACNCPGAIHPPDKCATCGGIDAVTSGGVITICTKDLEHEWALKRALRHELQHVSQCGGRDVCSYGRETRDLCKAKVIDELEAYLCGDRGTGQACDPELIKKNPNKLYSCLESIGGAILGPGDPVHNVGFCPGCIRSFTDTSGCIDGKVIAALIGWGPGDVSSFTCYK